MHFKQFLQHAFNNGQYATDDVIAFVLPLFKQVVSLHEAGLVAPFDVPGALQVTDRQPVIDAALAQPARQALQKIDALFNVHRYTHLQVVEEAMIDAREQEAVHARSQQVHTDAAQPVTQPVYLKGYHCYEQALGHHDAQTDIFCLGLIMGSIALGLNLYEEEALLLWATHRSNPVQFNPRLHPTLGALITSMTEPDRHQRLQDLYDAIHRLEHYRDYDPEKHQDLSHLPGWVHKTITGRSQQILNRLRNRLFDTSRRNRLLYYKANKRFVNLTVSSVPMVLHYQSIRPELLFTWNAEVEKSILAQQEMVLNKFLRFEDHPYLPAALDKIRVEANRDIQEYGFSQLKLVIAFLNWHNLKEEPGERIQSPLLLIPAELKKNKKLKEDHYVLKILDNAAEVNPVLASYLLELYGIRLPDFVELDEMSLGQFYQLLKQQIEKANQGIVLHYVNKPRIRLVHRMATQTVNNYNNRQQRMTDEATEEAAGRTVPATAIAPELFSIPVTDLAAPTAIAASTLEESEPANDGSATHTSFELAAAPNHPYNWEVDVCNMVLGNFHYKKMSLVRDYNFVVDQEVEHEVFEQLFSTQPRPAAPVLPQQQSPDWHPVITADPTQTLAVLQSRGGNSYIIQGPPGTGKSQTITNLVADFAARGKSVLFVCEKRAALDVVYHRLKQQGLDELCCYIHDSQGDKRGFIRDLKTTYEACMRPQGPLARVEQERQHLLQQLQEPLAQLQLFHDTHKTAPPEAGTAIRNLIERIIELKEQLLPVTPLQEEALPHYNDWLQFGGAIEQLSEALEAAGNSEAFGAHPFSLVKETIFLQEQPQQLLAHAIEQAQRLLQTMQAVVHQQAIPGTYTSSWTALKNLVLNAVLLQPLATIGNLHLVLPGNAAAQTFDEQIRQYKQQQEVHKQAKAVNQHWQQPFSPQDTAEALRIAAQYETAFLGFLQGRWRRLKKQLQQLYDFTQHAVRPRYGQVLQQLQHEHEAQTTVLATRSALQQQYGLDNIEVTYLGIERLRARLEDGGLQYLLQHPQASGVITALSSLNNHWPPLEQSLNQCLYRHEEKAIAAINDELETIQANMPSLPDLLPALKVYAQLPAPMREAIRTQPLTPAQAEVSMAHKTWQQIMRQQRLFQQATRDTIEKATAQIKKVYGQLLRCNASYIRAVIRHRFLQHVELSNSAASQLDNDQRIFKKNYSEGRRILENEFSKTMRYKSIRELAGKESGLVLKDIKPIWLMSPLSVSDSLPLDVQFFDVVIFDEASQITLEEGVPALFRASQTIIVGDDKQMPPTNFFSTKAEDPDDLDRPFGHEEEWLSDDADSLLVQGARKLNSVMLGWHYRSRYETLISYSNHAFYEGGLLTIPDKTIHHVPKKAIIVTVPEEAVANADALFNRSISFHYHANGRYEKRANQPEAQYIAQLVRELLQRNTRDSIGIVAFSQEQQHAIENALTSLAATDKLFEQQLEDAYNRTEEEQFVGLIVKNLENIQGDERDIIILSVCYGFDARKKMIMNFGPINKRGGEKRLNVIFSRARKHMAIISSIQYHHITNEYNDGANYFRRFLQYAECVSLGAMQQARSILDSLVINKTAATPAGYSTVVVRDIRQALEKMGYEVAEQVGQSAFKCSLAVKANADDEAYTLGILIDDGVHYQQTDLLEQYFQRPGILQSFGWKVMAVFAKDWLQSPTRVLEQIRQRLHEEMPAAEETDTAPAAFTAPVDTADDESITDVAPRSPYDHLPFQRLVQQENGYQKFWEVAVDHHKLIVRFGRTGFKGQTQIKTFTDAATAQKEQDKMIREKKGKGYAAAG